MNTRRKQKRRGPPRKHPRKSTRAKLLFTFFSAAPICLAALIVILASKFNSNSYKQALVVSPPGSVEQMRWPSSERFIDKLVQQRVPVVLTDTPARHWGAMNKWTPDFLERCLRGVSMQFKEAPPDRKGSFLFYSPKAAKNQEGYSPPVSSVSMTIKTNRKAIASGHQLYYSIHINQKYQNQNKEEGNLGSCFRSEDLPQLEELYSTEHKPLHTMMKQEPPHL